MGALQPPIPAAAPACFLHTSCFMHWKHSRITARRLCGISPGASSGSNLLLASYPEQLQPAKPPRLPPHHVCVPPSGCPPSCDRCCSGQGQRLGRAAGACNQRGASGGSSRSGGSGCGSSRQHRLRTTVHSCAACLLICLAAAARNCASSGAAVAPAAAGAAGAVAACVGGCLRPWARPGVVVRCGGRVARLSSWRGQCRPAAPGAGAAAGRSS